MRETLATAPDRAFYIAHARAHDARIKKVLPRVQRRAEAQRRNDPAERGRTGSIKRLEEYREILAQYQAEFALYDAMMQGENVRTLEPPPPEIPDALFNKLASKYEQEKRSGEADNGS